MDDFLGRLVISSAGRDKGCICAVVGIPDEEGFVLIADGKLRKVEKPKKKKLMHIKPIDGLPADRQKIDRDHLTNRYIREAVADIKSEFADKL